MMKIQFLGSFSLQTKAVSYIIIHIFLYISNNIFSSHFTKLKLFSIHSVYVVTRTFRLNYYIKKRLFFPEYFSSV